MGCNMTQCNENQDVPLAHSPSQHGEHGDPYSRHAEAVRRGAHDRAEQMLQYATNPVNGLVDSINAAAMFHDLGKLDSDIQTALRKGRSGKLKWDHIDAGVAHLTNKHHPNWMAAWLVRAHHKPGLPQETEHFAGKTSRQLRGRRSEKQSERDIEQIERTNTYLAQYLQEHTTAMGTLEVQGNKPFHGLTMRLALSCLVDADHTDSAFFDNGEKLPEPLKGRWAERLSKLCQYVRDLPEGITEDERKRNAHRKAFFDACIESSINASMVSCEAPVGMGKTTSIAAYLIRRAESEKLRRLIVVAPFTNILTQTARVLRKALLLDGEQPDRVIIEHHHRADFDSKNDREFAALWRAPIIVTTAVSLFETLSACRPSALRKLHAVPGSAIFIDEAHAALPTKLWPQNWKWLCELAENWGCRFVFGSGSLARFWESESIVVEKARDLPELMPERQKIEVMSSERHRVVFESLNSNKAVNVEQLIDLINKSAGPRLVILNTVQNAAVVAKKMRDTGSHVLHISTALTPHDREIILDRVQRLLYFRGYSDWTLVATSCIEAGVNLSFRTAFRERFTVASTIQTAGRVNRHGEYDALGGGVIYDFALNGKGITQHLSAEVSADILRDLMQKNALNTRTPADLVTEAMIEELSQYGGMGHDPLSDAEKKHDYPRVAELGRVICADTHLVVIDTTLIERLSNYEHVGFQEILRGSVQLWSNKIDKLDLKKIRGHEDIYSWSDAYDPDFLGYMEGILRNDAFLQNNDAWII